MFNPSSSLLNIWLSETEAAVKRNFSNKILLAELSRDIDTIFSNYARYLQYDVILYKQITEKQVFIPALTYLLSDFLFVDESSSFNVLLAQEMFEQAKYGNLYNRTWGCILAQDNELYYDLKTKNRRSFDSLF